MILLRGYSGVFKCAICTRTNTSIVLLKEMYKDERWRQNYKYGYEFAKKASRGELIKNIL